MKTLLVLAALFLSVLAQAQTHAAKKGTNQPLTAEQEANELASIFFRAQAAKKTPKGPLTAAQVVNETASIFFPFFAGSPLKQKNPNELAVLTKGGASCGLSDKEVLKTVEGVLIRSRIRPRTKLPADDKFYLGVVVSCAKDTHSVLQQVFFGDFILGTSIRFGDDYGSYGAYGTGDAPQFVLNELKGDVERAMTDYMKANFNLAPQ